MTAKILYLPPRKTHVLTHDELRNLYQRLDRDLSRVQDEEMEDQFDGELWWRTIYFSWWWLVCLGLWAGGVLAFVLGYLIRG